MIDYSRYTRQTVPQREPAPATQRNNPPQPAAPRPALRAPLDARHAPDENYDDWETSWMRPPTRKDRHVPPFEALRRSWTRQTTRDDPPDQPTDTAG